MYPEGNAQGKNQQEGALGPTKRGAERPYILKPLKSGNPIWITIRPAPLGKQPLYQGEANTVTELNNKSWLGILAEENEKLRL